MDQKQTESITRQARKILADKEAFIQSVHKTRVVGPVISCGGDSFDAMDVIWKMAEQIVADHPEVPDDLRVGMSVKLKYPADVLSDLMAGMAGIVTGKTQPGYDPDYPSGLVTVKLNRDTFVTTEPGRWKPI
jgi:hypothetical protein